ncbi:hypothetical protein QJQ45_009031 [Haematococcus lacustris]|nr:hypothetical protein QJQ45_009031 [Haematococcus lacustris]
MRLRALQCQARLSHWELIDKAVQLNKTYSTRNNMVGCGDRSQPDNTYRDSGITRQAQATKTWLAQVKPQLKAVSQVSSKPSSLASYRQFTDTVLATYDAMWAEVSKPMPSSSCIVARSAWWQGSGPRGVPVSQMLKEAVRQFPAGRVLMVDEFGTSRVSSAYSNPSEALPGQPPEPFRWLRPLDSKAKRFQSAQDHVPLSCADGKAMQNPGRPGQEWVYLPDKALLRKWRRKGRG